MSLEEAKELLSKLSSDDYYRLVSDIVRTWGGSSDELSVMQCRECGERDCVDVHQTTMHFIEGKGDYGSWICNDCYE